MWIAEVLNAAGTVVDKIFLKVEVIPTVLTNESKRLVAISSITDILKTIHLKGPVCKIGRKDDNGLSFPADQSISRAHAEVHISGSQASLKDLGSKFGTTLTNTDNGIPFAFSVTPTELVSGQLVTFGRVASTVRFVRVLVNVCVTRLDKKEKEKVKHAIEIIGGKIVQSSETATHIATNIISGATAKILGAIVFRKVIVRTDWFDFANTEKPTERIPAPEW
jgi:FHA domain